MIKRNIIMYIKQKSSIIAFSFIFLSLICFVISFLPSLQYKKGVTDQFKQYDITYMTTNNFSVTYLVSDNHLFFSQNKKQTSSLNDFAGIKDYSNEYGDPTNNYYNFIKIDYDFPCKIIDVRGISDNMVGDEGETFVLTENGNLYLISQRNTNVEIILKDVKKINVKYDSSINEEVYLIYDYDNNLSLYYFKLNQLRKYEIYSGLISDFYYIEEDKILIVEDNELKLLEFDIKGKEELYTYKTIITYSYPISQVVETIDVVNKSTGIVVDKIIEINDKYYYLSNNNVTSIQFSDTIITKEIYCKENINDIYPTGEDACIAICDKNLYYIGELKNYKTNYDEFVSLDINNGLIYGNRNSVILIDQNSKLYIYQENEYVGMYRNIFVTIIVRYVSLFLLVMINFYIILSFIEDSKRFNRYFKHHDK